MPGDNYAAAGDPGDSLLVFGHQVDAEVVRQGDGWHSRSASINRTARRLMDGYVYVSTANLDTGNFDSIGC